MACINDQPRLLLSLAGLRIRYACEYEVIIIYSLLLKMIMSLHACQRLLGYATVMAMQGLFVCKVIYSTISVV